MNDKIKKALKVSGVAGAAGSAGYAGYKNKEAIGAAAGKAVERGREVASNAAETVRNTARNVADTVSEKAGQAREFLGDATNRGVNAVKKLTSGENDGVVARVAKHGMNEHTIVENTIEMLKKYNNNKNK